MSGTPNVFKDVYHTEEYEFVVKNAEGKELQHVVHADAEQFLDRVIENRNLVRNIRIKAMADGGQNFTRISSTILPGNYSTRVIDNEICMEHHYDGNDENETKKRTLF